MAANEIRIGGAREHNLKNLSLAIPRDQLVVVTGLSGSGKSSLAFDTIYAEGQRKYVESLSTYARQFLDQMQKPEVDFIEGLSPTIAIEQRSAGGSMRSIIATTTEIYDYLRLLYAHVGQPHCPESGKPMASQTPTEIIDRLMALPEGTRLMLLAPVVQHQKGEFRDVIEKLAREGFVRARVDGELVELAVETRVKIDPKKKHDIEAVVDRLVVGEGMRQRLADSVETALKWGDGRLLALTQSPGVRGDNWEEQLQSTRMVSPKTGRSYDTLTPKHFSFNAPFGACTVCHGLGQKLVFDPELVVPNPEKSLAEGAIAPWRRGGRRMIIYYNHVIRTVAAHYEQSLDTPWEKLPESFREVLLMGSGDEEIEFNFRRNGKPTSKPFEGVVPNLERLMQETDSEFTKKRVKSCMSSQPCDACHGERLRPEVLACTLGGAKAKRLRPPSASGSRRKAAIPGLSIMEVCRLSVEDAVAFFGQLEFSELEEKIAGEVLKEIQARLGFLDNVGLGYLSLNRESSTLSGGEAQRIRLATQIGAGLVGVIYILDEPSIGLHQRDNDRLLETLKGLRDLGNTVLVVEHDEDTIRAADYVLDLGPGAGVHGGELVAVGTVEDVCKTSRSITGRYLTGEFKVEVPRERVQGSPEKGWLEIRGASENNLQNIDVRMPLGTLICVTGVSGSGKSTLVDDVLRRALYRKWHGSKEKPGAHDSIEGADLLDKAIVIDQSPIGRTPRSNPATYTNMFTHIRDLFAKLPAAKVRGYGPGRFSFNVKGGRCEKCQGDGMLKIEMHFLPAVYVDCEECSGRRYNRETLEIHYKGLNIADVLEMTVDEACAFFRAVPQVYDVCLTLSEVGLGYLQLGQSATTLSGGEAQRVKLASELCKRSTGRTLYLLDEPTTGLHFHDVARLLDVFAKLRDAGNTLVVIEHNLDVIKSADWLVDLGPEGGSGGGRVVAEGPPEYVARCKGSFTGEFLKRYLPAAKPKKRARKKKAA
jgi:excinuclease ABC subunit A